MLHAGDYAQGRDREIKDSSYLQGENNLESNNNDKYKTVWKMMK